MTDYHRSQIEDTLAAGLDVDDHFRVKPYGKRDTKFLNITTDQARNLADAMDETNPPSLLPMKNGARVLHADVHIDDDGDLGQGYVMARTRDDQWVTWRVYLHKGECRWLAESGSYFSTANAARNDYNERRSNDHVITIERETDAQGVRVATTGSCRCGFYGRHEQEVHTPADEGATSARIVGMHSDFKKTRAA